MTDWCEQDDDFTGATKRSGREHNVVQALERLEHSERDAVEDLRMAICAFVGSLRHEGATQEQVVIAVRRLVAAPASTDGAGDLAPAVREALVELAIHWCVDEYESSTKAFKPTTD